MQIAASAYLEYGRLCRLCMFVNIIQPPYLKFAKWVELLSKGHPCDLKKSTALLVFKFCMFFIQNTIRYMFYKDFVDNYMYTRITLHFAVLS